MDITRLNIDTLKDDLIVKIGAIFKVKIGKDRPWFEIIQTGNGIQIRTENPLKIKIGSSNVIYVYDDEYVDE